MSDEWEMAGTPVELTAAELDDPDVVSERVWLAQLAADHPIVRVFFDSDL